jgi:hypothetical protein
MSNELVPRIRESSGLAQTTPRVPRQVTKAIDRVAYRGLEASAKVQASGYVTHVALAQVAMLTAEEGRLIEQYPLGEPRFRVIVDTYAGMAAAEIAQLGF